MIEGISASNNVRQREAIQMLLSSSQYEFHLTGSRYFGKCTRESDWDFFVQDDITLRKSLEQLGFCKLESHKYKDMQVIDVYRSACNIDIQLVDNYKMKVAAHKMISTFCLQEYYMTKSSSLSSRNAFWNQIYSKIDDILNVMDLK